MYGSKLLAYGLYETRLLGTQYSNVALRCKLKPINNSFRIGSSR